MSSLSVNNALTNPVFQASWPQAIAAEQLPICSDPVECKNFINKIEGLINRIKAAFHRELLAFPNCFGAYPSPKITHSSKNKAQRQEFKEILKARFGGESVALKTPEGHTLDGMLFRGGQKKAILYCAGWKSYFEHDKRFDIIHDIVERVGDVNLMLFNPRGVGESEGTSSSEGAALDLYSAFQYLTEVEGIDPNDIVIYGHSLGAAYGATGAKLVQEEYPEAGINLFSERSFVDHEENARALILKNLSSWPNLGKIVGGIVAALFKSWRVQVEEAVVSLKGKVCIVYNKIDEAVPFSCSVYQTLKQRIAQGLHVAQPIRCIKLFEPEAPLPKGYSPHTRYLTPWEKQEIANELKKMLGLESEDPINIRRVKEMGAPKLGNKDFTVALHAVNQLYAHLERAEPVTENILDNSMMMSFSLQTESLLLKHFREQETALSRVEDPFLTGVTPEGNKRFYLSVLARTRVALVLEELEKNFREHRGVRESDRQLLQMLEEGMPITFERLDLNRLFNPVELLYALTYQIYEQRRQDGVPWPAPDSPDFGRSGFTGEVFFPNSVRLEALQEFKNLLL